MCGIFGAVSSNKVSVDNNIMPHRGPDDWGVEYIEADPNVVTFFQSRLSIIGLGKQGHQPFTKNGNDFLIYNGVDL